MRAAAAVLALAVAACSTAPAPPAPATAPAPAPQSPAPLPAPPEPAAPKPAADTCGAAPLQNLIGRPRTESPVPIDPRKQRVTCTTCPVTMDFRPDRLNIFFDAQTGIIKEVRCG